MIMRFGIMTFSRANNYGAILQAYALRKKLQDKGQECQLINYRCKSIDAMHAFKKFNKKLTFRQNWTNFLWNIIFYPRMLAFDRFRKDLQTEAYWPETIAQANDKFDCFITGSDQVFNLKLTGGDPAYYLNFVAEDKAGRLTLSAWAIIWTSMTRSTRRMSTSLICSPSGKRQALIRSRTVWASPVRLFPILC